MGVGEWFRSGCSCRHGSLGLSVDADDGVAVRRLARQSPCRFGLATSCRVPVFWTQALDRGLERMAQRGSGTGCRRGWVAAGLAVRSPARCWSPSEIRPASVDLASRRIRSAEPRRKGLPRRPYLQDPVCPLVAALACCRCRRAAAWPDTSLVKTSGVALDLCSESAIRMRVWCVSLGTLGIDVDRPCFCAIGSSCARVRGRFAFAVMFTGCVTQYELAMIDWFESS